MKRQHRAERIGDGGKGKTAWPSLLGHLCPKLANTFMDLSIIWLTVNKYLSPLDILIFLKNHCLLRNKSGKTEV